MEKTKIFISQPMNGLNEEEIKTEREKIEKAALTEYPNGEIVDSYFGNFDTTNIKNKLVAYLGKSICKLAESDVAYFGKGWEKARGCRIEHSVCEDYNIKIVEMEI